MPDNPHPDGAVPRTPPWQAVHNACDGLAEALLNGADLSIFLRPDDTVKARSGTHTYIETLALPHAIVSGSHVWAFQENHAVQHQRGASFDGFGYFAYTNAADLFANVVYTHRMDALQQRKVRVQVMSSGRYAELNWITKDRYRKVWDSEAATGPQDVVSAIRAGARFKVALQDDSGIWNIHPVHYPFFTPDLDRLQFQTHAQFYPALMRAPAETFLPILDQNAPGIFNAFDPVDREKTVRLEDGAVSTYYSAYDDGSYYGMFDLFETANRRYRRLCVFAST